MIDADVHQNFVRTLELLPWMDPAIRAYVTDSGFSLPGLLWPNPHGYVRAEARPPADGGPDSHYELMRTQLLDPYSVEYAVINGGDVMMLGILPNPELAAGLATAWNRWLTEDWLTRDRRFKGSMVVATQDPELAAKEIRRFGGHDDIVQVLINGGAPVPYGHRRYHPIYEAAVEMGLVVGIHPGGEGLGINSPPATGYPTYYIELHTLFVTVAMAHVVSLVCHGVFEKYPELRVAVIEFGLAWLPGVLWRLDTNWKALRNEVPWVTKLPSETVREHMRFTTQPLEQPRSTRQLRQVLDALEGMGDMLMFSSDYPHWDADTVEQAKRLPEDWQDRVLSENARAFYRLPVRESTTELAVEAVG
jgi:predicted TIM-barrel fold metal-dependent hydrolase